MAADCRAGQYWDILIKRCIHCHTECQRPYIIPRCIIYCKSAKCKALPGHYYDGLLRKCVMCAEVCGRHPAECSQCDGYGFMQTGLDPILLLYLLLALSMVLLFTSLSLALVVFLRRARAESSNPGPKEAKHNQECRVQHGQEVGQPGQSFKGKCGMDKSQRPQSNPKTTTSYSKNHNISIRCLYFVSIPTETCICVHCFPDLKALSHGNDRPLRTPFSFYPYPVLHRRYFFFFLVCGKKKKKNKNTIDCKTQHRQDNIRI
uniref:TACI cysteine-rich domain-containing protein n=1 Tax=Mola mola TaxID=94237 RepID=A0A3Q3WBI4_MOLML